MVIYLLRPVDELEVFMSVTLASFNMTIGGEGAAAERTFGVINPATGAVFAEAPDCPAVRK